MARDLDLGRLERALRLAAPELDYPAAAGVWESVALRLADVPARRRASRMPALRAPVLRPVVRPVWHVVTAVVVALALILSGVLAASPTVRQTVERWLGLRGVKVVETPRPSTLPPTRTLGDGLDLGARIDLADAEQRLGEQLLFPQGLGTPDALYIRDLSIGGSEVFLVYRDRPGIPTAGTTGVALLVSEFTGEIYRPGFQKLSFGATIDRVTVNGGRGLWIEGGHGLAYLDANGEEVQDQFRLAGNVLLWEQGDLTVRIESALTKAEALPLGATFR
jgi:hypothetical protein